MPYNQEQLPLPEEPPSNEEGREFERGLKIALTSGILGIANFSAGYYFDLQGDSYNSAIKTGGFVLAVLAFYLNYEWNLKKN